MLVPVPKYAPALHAEGGGRVPLLQDGDGVDDEEEGERGEAHVGGARLDAPPGQNEELRQRLPLPVRLPKVACFFSILNSIILLNEFGV